MYTWKTIRKVLVMSLKTPAQDPVFACCDFSSQAAGGCWAAMPASLLILGKGKILKKKLIDLIPEFNLIEDSALREKVLAAWDEAIKLGGWEVGDLEKIPFTLSLKDCPINLKDHVRGVTQACVSIEKIFKKIYNGKIKINRDSLVAGALLHDVGKLLECKKEGGKYIKSRSGYLLRHPFSGVALCYKHGIPEDILHLIAVHSKEGEGFKRTTEAIILNHADFANFDVFSLDVALE